MKSRALLVVYAVLLLELVALFAIPPRYGVSHIKQYDLYHPGAGSWFAIGFVASIALQFVGAWFMRARKPYLATVLAFISLLLAASTFNPTRSDMPLGDWLLLPLLVFREPDTFVASVAQRLPILASALVLLVSAVLAARHLTSGAAREA